MSLQKWFSTTSQVLEEQPEHLQRLVLHISRENPEMGFYASDLACLRMSGMEMDKTLSKIWHADSESCLEEIMTQQPDEASTSSHALPFLIDLVKNNINAEYRHLGALKN